MRCVFVSGAITPTGKGNHVLEFLENIRRGIRLTIDLIQAGYAVYCPFSDFTYWLVKEDGEKPISPEQIYTADKEILKRMDAVLVVPGTNWKDSVGVCGELAKAKELGIPIFTDIETLKKAIK